MSDIGDIADKIAKWRALCKGNSFGEDALREAAAECEAAHQQLVQSVLRTENLRGRIAKLETMLRFYEGDRRDLERACREAADEVKWLSGFERAWRVEQEVANNANNELLLANLKIAKLEAALQAILETTGELETEYLATKGLES